VAGTYFRYKIPSLDSHLTVNAKGSRALSTTVRSKLAANAISVVTPDGPIFGVRWYKSLWIDSSHYGLSCRAQSVYYAPDRREADDKR